MPCSMESYGILVAVSAGYLPVTGKSLTCYAPFRRSPPEYCYPALPLDLHVLSLPLAFILSQDQTLLCIFIILQVRIRHSQFHIKKSTLSIFVLLVLASLYLIFQYFQSTTVVSQTDCKDTHFFIPCKYFRTFFEFFIDFYR